MTYSREPIEFVQGVRMVIDPQVQGRPFIFPRNDQRRRLPAAPVTPQPLRRSSHQSNGAETARPNFE
jgi:hypothetical protein